MIIMLIAELDSALGLVGTGFEAAVDGLEPLVKSSVRPPELFLSTVSLGTMLLGPARPEAAALAAARALEFLEQALNLGSETRPETEIESALLITDYLYAQAIDQVVDQDRPVVIGALAGAIMATAEDRAAGVIQDHRSRLIVAALEIGAHLGEITGPLVEELNAVKVSVIQSSDGWPDRFPPGPIKDRLVEVRPAVNGA
jgi:hypothetical protein